jgi:hypothetical protein
MPKVAKRQFLGYNNNVKGYHLLNVQTQFFLLVVIFFFNEDFSTLYNHGQIE